MTLSTVIYIAIGLSIVYFGVEYLENYTKKTCDVCGGEYCDGIDDNTICPNKEIECYECKHEVKFKYMKVVESETTTGYRPRSQTRYYCPNCKPEFDFFRAEREDPCDEAPDCNHITRKNRDRDPVNCIVKKYYKNTEEEVEVE